MKYKIAMNTLVYGPDMNESIIQHLAYIKEVGYEGVEIPIFVVDQEYWKPWKAEIDRLGLTVFTVTFLGADMNTISSDPAVRQKGIEFLIEGLDQERIEDLKSAGQFKKENRARSCLDKTLRGIIS